MGRDVKIAVVKEVGGKNTHATSARRGEGNAPKSGPVELDQLYWRLQPCFTSTNGQ